MKLMLVVFSWVLCVMVMLIVMVMVFWFWLSLLVLMIFFMRIIFSVVVIMFVLKCIGCLMKRFG